MVAEYFYHTSHLGNKERTYDEALRFQSIHTSVAQIREQNSLNSEKRDDNHLKNQDILFVTFEKSNICQIGFFD